MGLSGPEALIGQTLKGKYHLSKVLGQGGMAAVYLATHRNGNRVAVKVLHPLVSLNEEVRQRFLREGYVANRVEHSGAVHVLDDDVDEEGRVFIVMELLEGETLGSRIEGRPYPMAASDVLPLMVELLEVLAAAHRAGIVHRDIKPDNVFITRKGEVKVLDFGIARLHDAASMSAATQTGSLAGTPAFMPPEQALGRTKAINAQTDLWAVGATIFYSLTKQYVHPAESLTECLIYAGTRPARSLATVVPGATPALVELVDRALRFEQQDRWTSADEMAEAARRAVAEVRSVRTAPLSAPGYGSAFPEGVTRPIDVASHLQRPMAPSPAATPGWGAPHPPGTGTTLSGPGAMAASAADPPLAVAGVPSTKSPLAWILGGGAALVVAIAAIAGVVSFRDKGSTGGEAAIPSASTFVPPPIPEIPAITPVASSSTDSRREAKLGANDKTKNDSPRDVPKGTVPTASASTKPIGPSKTQGKADMYAP